MYVSDSIPFPSFVTTSWTLLFQLLTRDWSLDLRNKFKQLQKDLSPSPRPFYGFVTTVIVSFVVSIPTLRNVRSVLTDKLWLTGPRKYWPYFIILWVYHSFWFSPSVLPHFFPLLSPLPYPGSVLTSSFISTRRHSPWTYQTGGNHLEGEDPWRTFVSV